MTLNGAGHSFSLWWRPARAGICTERSREVVKNGGAGLRGLGGITGRDRDLGTGQCRSMGTSSANGKLNPSETGKFSVMGYSR
jgi:hypothetical protein